MSTERLYQNEGKMVLNEKELVEIRAAQRTFEGAYIRTCISSFSFALLILRLFEPAFYYIGMVFIIFGGAILGISTLRRRHNIDLLDTSKPFKTAGGYVVLTGFIAFATYTTLLFMIYYMR